MTTSNSTIDDTEWERRFKARIVQRLVGSNELGVGWTQAEAEEAARDEFEAIELYELRDGFEDDPESSADECLSYWADGA